MLPTFKNRIKLFWHGLTKLHQSASISDHRGIFHKTKAIWCHTCRPELWNKFVEMEQNIRNRGG